MVFKNSALFLFLEISAWLFFILNLRNTVIPILVFLPPTIAALDMPRDNWTRHVLDV